MGLVDKLAKAKLGVAAALAEVVAKTYVITTYPIVIGGLDVFPGMRDHLYFTLPFAVSFLGACAYTGYRLLTTGDSAYQNVKDAFWEIEKVKQAGKGLEHKTFMPKSVF